MAILRFIISNIRTKKTYTAIIFVLCLFVGVLSSVGMSLLNDSGEAYDRAINEGNYSHIYFYMPKENYKEDMKTFIEKYQGVEKVHYEDEKMYNGAYIRYKDTKICESADIFFLKYSNERKRKLTGQSEQFNGQLQAGQVILPYIMHSKNKINVNEKVTLQLGNRQIELKVIAFFENPKNGAELMGNKDIYISDKDYNSITGPLASDYGYLGIRLKAYSLELQKKICKAFLNNYNNKVHFVVSFDSIKSGHLILSSIILAILITFAVLLCIITLIILRYAIMSTTEADYVNIGILKALGFTPLMIRVAITAQYYLIALSAGLLSFVASIFTSNYTWSIVLSSTGLFSEGNLSIKVALVSIFILTFVIGAFSWISAGKAGKISPMRAISKGRTPAHFNSVFNIRLEKLAFIPFNLRMAVKQFSSKIKRYAFLVLISALLIYLVMFLFGFVSYMKSDKSIAALGAEISDIEIDTETKADAVKLTDQIKKDFDVTWLSFKQPNIEVLIDDERFRSEVKDDFEQNGVLTTIEGRHPKHDNEIAITKLVKSKLGKDIGDYVTILDAKGNKHQFIITGIFQSFQEAGSIVRICESGIKIIYPDFELNEVYVKLKDNSNIDKTISEIKAKYSGYTEISNQMEEDKENIDTFRKAFFAVANLVLAVTLIMIIIITILIVKVDIHSETGELGIYKAMGFSSARLRIQLALRFLIITVIGALVGGITEYLSCTTLASNALQSVGMANLNIRLTLLEALYPIAIVITGSVLAALVCSGRIKRISAYELISE